MVVNGGSPPFCVGMAAKPKRSVIFSTGVAPFSAQLPALQKPSKSMPTSSLGNLSWNITDPQ